MTTVFVIRHGRTALNAGGALRGRVDVPLDAVGLAEAARLGELFGSVPLTVVVSSPLRRARHTAEPVARSTGAPVRLEEAFTDRDVGRWSGMPAARVAERFGGLDRAPGVEPRAEFDRRVLAGWTALTAELAAQTFAVVTHDAVIACLLEHVLGHTVLTDRTVRQPTGSWNRLEQRDGGWSAVALGVSPDAAQPNPGQPDSGQPREPGRSRTFALRWSASDRSGSPPIGGRPSVQRPPHRGRVVLVAGWDGAPTPRLSGLMAPGRFADWKELPVSSMTAAAPAPPDVACVNVPGTLGPSCDAVRMDGPLYGVADAPDGAVGQAERWLDEWAGRLGRRPRGADLKAVLRQQSGRWWLPGTGRPEVTGAAVAVLEPGWLTVAQLGTAAVHRIRDHRPVLVAGAGRLGAVSVVRLRPWPGDRYVLATDGFWELLDDQTLAELTAGNPAETCTRLHDLALDRLVEDAAAVVLAFRQRW